MIELLPLWMVLSLMALLFSGYPVALVLIGVSIVFASIAIAAGSMSVPMVQMFYARVYSLLADNLIFPAVPPLIFMGVALAKTGVVRDLMDVVSRRLRAVPGGLSITVLLVGVLLAPTAGLLGAAVGMLALATLPTMLEHRYEASVATAAVAAAGTLGVVLPPAVMLFFLSDLVGAPIIGMFTGILYPSAALLLMYMTYFAWRGGGSPRAPSAASSGRTPAKALASIFGPIAIVASVLGPIASGWATPSQAGSFGAIGTLLLMAAKSSLGWFRLKEILIETAHITAMVFLVIIAANAFSFVFRVLDGDQLVAQFLGSLGLGAWGTLLFVLAVIFVLGFFIDWLEIVLITLPIFMPVIDKLDFTAHVGTPLLAKVWIGTAVAIVLQTSFLTPPFGFALFFLRGAAPPEVRMAEIYRGIVPIVAIQLFVLALILSVPWLATSLPSAFID